jgi:hypothetical protein
MQAEMFEVDMIGRKAAKLGLSHDNEIVVQLLDGARRLHASLTRYQIGIVDAEMSRLGGSDRANELKRLWSDAFTNYANFGELLAKWAPTDALIEAEIQNDIAAEKKALAEATNTEKGDAIDQEYRKLMGENEPPEETEE